MARQNSNRAMHNFGQQYGKRPSSLEKHWTKQMSVYSDEQPPITQALEGCSGYMPKMGFLDSAVCPDVLRLIQT